MAERHPHEGPPHPLHSLLEWRALGEAALLPTSWPLLMSAPQGDGHVVLLLPGFLADEVSLFALRWFLSNRGYDVHTWGFGRNVGFRSRLADAVVQKIRWLHHKSGRKISLVGWSLGGVFALYGAHEAPECVRSVLTLGSPVSADPESPQSPQLVRLLYRLVAHPHGPRAHAMHPRVKRMRLLRAPGVPTSCLYSVTDGIVPPQEATIEGDPAANENIRVPGSHTGLGFNGLVLAIVADRLAQPEGRWRPFSPSGPLAALYRVLTRAA
jgi:pimeloyl-ACP methyl ester carboxylesterase